MLPKSEADAEERDAVAPSPSLPFKQDTHFDSPPQKEHLVTVSELEEGDVERYDYEYKVSKSFQGGYSSNQRQRMLSGRMNQLAANNSAVDEQTSSRADPTPPSNTKTPPWPFTRWSNERFWVTMYGLMSSCTVLTVRLFLDQEPVAYFIHSIIVFIDMILIHICTHDVRLSVAGELITIIFFLTFHFTKQTLYELLETTLLAVIVSFHLIGTRKEVMEERNELEEEVRILKRRGSIIIRNLDQVLEEKKRSGRVPSLVRNIDQAKKELSSADLNSGQQPADDSSLCEFILENDGELYEELMKEDGEAKRPKFAFDRIHSWFENEKHIQCKATAKMLGHTFFEFFLDGAAGVM